MRTEIKLKIRRQDNPSSQPYWEEFILPYRRRLNVISCLMEIQRYPVNAQGARTKPVVWECNCLEEVCGACAMSINGQPRQACTALIDQLPEVVVLEPLSKFPTVRDLVVNRKKMFENLRRVKAWINIDGTYDLGPGPRVPPKAQQWAYELQRCMTCGNCLEACPQVNPRSDFVGAAAIVQVQLMNGHPTGSLDSDQRLEALMGPGGISECGNAQNCEKACPKGLPLVASIGDVNRQVNRHAILDWFKR